MNLLCENPQPAVRCLLDEQPEPVSTPELTGRLAVSGLAGQAEPVEVNWRMHGPAESPVLVAMGGISADCQVDHWWHGLYGAGRALDFTCHRILSLDWASWPDGKAFTTDQQADVLARLLDHLAIDRVAALIGASFGAMVGLAFAARHPGRTGRLIAISGAHRAHPMAIARRRIQREIVQLGLDNGQPRRALALARALALTTYRPPSLFASRFSPLAPDQAAEQVGAYLDHSGQTFAERFDPLRYLSLSSALDAHAVDPASLHCRVDLVAVDSDELVPARQLVELTNAIGPHCRLWRIRSPYGHDGFLKEPGQLNRLLGNLLGDLLDDLDKEPCDERV